MRRDPRLIAMTDHIIELAESRGVHLTWLPTWRQAESWPDLEEATVPEVLTPADYLIGMHELGHVLDPLARDWHDRLDPYGRVVCEGAAWAWAASRNRFDLSLRDWDRAGRCFRSYLAAPDPDEGWS